VPSPIITRALEIILKTINEWGADLDLGSWSARRAVPVRRPEVIKALRELTRVGYAQAYILDTRKPYAQPVDFREDEVDHQWFLATLTGIRGVKQFLENE